MNLYNHDFVCWPSVGPNDMKHCNQSREMHCLPSLIVISTGRLAWVAIKANMTISIYLGLRVYIHLGLGFIPFFT